MPMPSSAFVKALEFGTATEMHERMCEKLCFGKTLRDRDWAHGMGVGLHDVTIGCRSFDWSFDLKRLWVLPSRWDMMVRQYIDPGELTRFLGQIEDRLSNKGRGVATMRTLTVQTHGSGLSTRRRWGSCMINVFYRNHPVPTLTLNSRTTYFGYLAALDVTVAHLLAKMIGEILGIDVKDVRFVWTLAMAQFHGFRSIAWLLGDPERKRMMDVDVQKDLKQAFPFNDKPGSAPGYAKALREYNKFLSLDERGVKYGDQKYKSLRKNRRRFHREVMGERYARRFEGGAADVDMSKPVPSTPVSELSFDCLYKKTKMILDPEEEEDEDDE